MCCQCENQSAISTDNFCPRGRRVSYDFTALVSIKMSTLSLDKELQERLREASAIGDIDEVRTLVESGVNINSQNEINGW